MPNELYSIDQAAAYLGVSESTVRRRLKAGKLQGEKVKGEYGEQWFIYVQSLQSCKSYEQGQALPTLKELEGVQKGLIVAACKVMGEELATAKEEMLTRVSAELGQLSEQLDQLQEENKQLYQELKALRKEKTPFWIRWFRS